VARAVGGVEEVWPEALAPLLAVPGPGEEDLVAPLRRLLAASPEELHAWRMAAHRACLENFEITAQAERLAAWLQGLVRTGGTGMEHRA